VRCEAISQYTPRCPPPAVAPYSVKIQQLQLVLIEAVFVAVSMDYYPWAGSRLLAIGYIGLDLGLAVSLLSVHLVHWCTANSRNANKNDPLDR